MQNNERPAIVGELSWYENGAMLEYRDEESQELKLHASAQKLDDYQGKVVVWHSDAGRKIQDARLSLQVRRKLEASIDIFLHLGHIHPVF